MTTNMIIRYKKNEDVPALLELQSFEKDTLSAAFRILVDRLMLEDNFLLIRDARTDDVTLRTDTLRDDYRFWPTTCKASEPSWSTPFGRLFFFTN